MTIGVKKLSQLIQVEVENFKTLTPTQKKDLADLCIRIFTIEASASSGVSSQRLAESIRTDIAQVADRLKGTP